MEASKGLRTKEKIIRTAARLFLQKGYHATGINEILAQTGVPKGSFYFHFKSKKELTSHVAQFYSDRLQAWFEETAKNKKWNEFIGSLVADMKLMAQKGRHFGCPLGVIGVEIALHEPEITGQYVQVMDNIMKIFSGVLESSGVDSTEAPSAARRAFILYQGYLQYYRMTRNIEVFDYLLNDVTRMLNC